MICKRSEKDGQLYKMSKSKGNVVSPDELIRDYGVKKKSEIPKRKAADRAETDSSCFTHARHVESGTPLKSQQTESRFVPT